MGGDDRIVADALDEGRDERRRAGGDDDGIGREFLHVLDRGFLLELELHAGLLGAVVQVREPLAHLLLAGRDDRQIQLTADLLALFPDGNVVAALGRRDSGVHAAGAGANDEDLLRLVGRVERIVILVADERVDVALADRMMRIFRRDAPAAAGAAGRDVIEAVLVSFLRQVGVCEQRTAHRHAVHQTTLHQIGGVAHVVDLADNENRDVHDLLDLRRLVDVHADLLAVGRKDVLKALILDAAGDFEHVNARSLELRGEVKHFIQGVAARLTLGTGDTQHDREIGTDVAAALFNDLQDQARTVVDAAAVLVHALIAQRAEECARQHIGVRDVQGNAAAAGLFGAARGLAVLLDDLVDLVNGDRAADSAVGVRVHGRAERRDALERTDGLRAGVNELREERAAGIAHALGKGGKLRDEGVLVQRGRLADVPILMIDRDCVDDDVAGAALCAAHKNIRELLGHRAVGRLIVHAHRRHGDTVFQRRSAQLQGREDFRIFHIGYHVIAS